jgi:hypothetical protein
MAELSIDFNPEQLIGKVNDLQKLVIPRAAELALNETVFAIREQMKEKIPQIFDRPVPLTINSTLYKKAAEVNQQLQATVFIRDDVPKGNAVSRYLNSQINGGLAYRTRFAKKLGNIADPDESGGNAPILAPNRVMVPAIGSKNVRLNQYGNMSPGQFTQIIAALENSSSAGGGTFQGKGGVNYIYFNQTMVDERRLRNTKPGIFRVKGRELSRVMTEIPTPTNNGKFKFFDISRQIADTEFPKRFLQRIIIN